MFSAAKAQFDLAMAWSELAMSTFTATTMIANSGAKVLAAAERVNRPQESPSQAFFNPWVQSMPQSGVADPMRFAMAASQASIAFWSALLEPPVATGQRTSWMTMFEMVPQEPPKPKVAPLPLWWTAFTDPVLARPKTATVQPRNTYLH